MRKGWLSDEDVTQEAVEEFLSGSGKRFYGIEVSKVNQTSRSLLLERRNDTIPPEVKSRSNAVTIIPFRANQEVWSLQWKSNS